MRLNNKMTQEELPFFNGAEYKTKADHKRLSNQHFRIKALMLDHKWRTLQQISDATGDPVASVSAQLRHLRKKRFGEFRVERRSTGNRNTGLFEYRVLLPDQ